MAGVLWDGSGRDRVGRAFLMMWSGVHGSSWAFTWTIQAHLNSSRQIEESIIFEQLSSRHATSPRTTSIDVFEDVKMTLPPADLPYLFPLTDGYGKNGNH